VRRMTTASEARSTGHSFLKADTLSGRRIKVVFGHPQNGTTGRQFKPCRPPKRWYTKVITDFRRLFRKRLVLRGFWSFRGRWLRIPPSPPTTLRPAAHSRPPSAVRWPACASRLSGAFIPIRLLHDGQPRRRDVGRASATKRRALRQGRRRRHHRREIVPQIPDTRQKEIMRVSAEGKVGEVGDSRAAAFAVDLALCRRRRPPLHPGGKMATDGSVRPTEVSASPIDTGTPGDNTRSTRLLNLVTNRTIGKSDIAGRAAIYVKLTVAFHERSDRPPL